MRSNTSSCTLSGWQLGLSTLLITTIGRNPSASAFSSTNRVCGMGPSSASTSSSTPSAMLSTRSTSPPKSACPGVSMTLIFTPLCVTETFLLSIVIPRSRSSALLSRNWPSSLFSEPSTFVCRIILSTNVVFPWSTCAIIAIFLTSIIDAGLTARKYKKCVFCPSPFVGLPLGILSRRWGVDGSFAYSPAQGRSASIPPLMNFI